MYMLNGWWFLSSSGSYPPVFMVDQICFVLLVVLSRDSTHTVQYLCWLHTAAYNYIGIRLKVPNLWLYLITS